MNEPKRADANVKGSPETQLGIVKNDLTLTNKNSQLSASTSKAGNLVIGGRTKDQDGSEWMLLNTMPMNPETGKVFSVEKYDLSNLVDANTEGEHEWQIGVVKNDFTLTNEKSELYARTSQAGNLVIGGSMKDNDGTVWFVKTLMPINPETKKTYAVDDYDLSKLIETPPST
jgi:hypothetical protein